MSAPAEHSAEELAEVVADLRTLWQEDGTIVCSAAATMLELLHGRATAAEAERDEWKRRESFAVSDLQRQLAAMTQRATAAEARIVELECRVGFLEELKAIRERQMDAASEAVHAAEAVADRRLGLLRLFARAAYPVATEINQRGYNWNMPDLDEALANAKHELTTSPEGAQQ